MSVLPSTLHALISCKPSNVALHELTGGKDPESVKAYSDIVYYNYTSQGFSLQLTPATGYKPDRTASSRSQLKESLLSLSTIDIYSPSYKAFPINLSYIPPVPPEQAESASGFSTSTIDLSASTTGKDLVSQLGEPDRKGGGESRSVGVWLEWTGLGLMVEFTGVHGHQKWDKDAGAGTSKVGVWSFFEPGKDVGKETD